MINKNVTIISSIQSRKNADSKMADKNLDNDIWSNVANMKKTVKDIYIYMYIYIYVYYIYIYVYIYICILYIYIYKYIYIYILHLQSSFT